MDSLTQEQIAELKKSFSLHDKDDDGLVTTDEFILILKSMGFSPYKEELQDMLNGLYQNFTGALNFDDFLRLVARKHTCSACGLEFSNLIEIFKNYDIKGNGMISEEDFKKVIHDLGENLTEQELVDLIAEAEPNEYNLINYEEFLKKTISK